MKKCPFCAEEIQDAAIVCKHCGRDIPVATTAPLFPSPTAAKARPNYVAALVLLLLGFLAMLTPAPWIGFFLAWVGFAFTMTGSGLVKWVGSLVLAFVMLMLVSLGSGFAGVKMPSSTDSLTAGSTDDEQLELLSSRGYETDSGGYNIVEGEVQNISNSKIDRVMVVASWFGEDGTLISTDDTLIEFDPIMPGQKSPFKSMIRSNPLMKTYKLSFKRMRGGAINTLDSRKK